MLFPWSGAMLKVEGAEGHVEESWEPVWALKRTWHGGLHCLPRHYEAPALGALVP